MTADGKNCGCASGIFDGDGRANVGIVGDFVAFVTFDSRIAVGTCDALLQRYGFERIVGANTGGIWFGSACTCTQMAKSKPYRPSSCDCMMTVVFKDQNFGKKRKIAKE